MNDTHETNVESGRKLFDTTFAALMEENGYVPLSAAILYLHVMMLSKGADMDEIASAIFDLMSRDDLVLDGYNLVYGDGKQGGSLVQMRIAIKSMMLWQKIVVDILESHDGSVDEDTVGIVLGTIGVHDAALDAVLELMVRSEIITREGGVLTLLD